MSRAYIRKQRYNRARLAGATGSPGEAWDSAVEKAIKMRERDSRALALSLQTGKYEPPRSELPERCGLGCVAVRAQAILDAEAALQAALMHVDMVEELTELGELNGELRARLRDKLDIIRAALKKKLAPDVN
jgi:hypothetical protein